MEPLSDQDAAKLVLTESAKKVSDLKAKQWEISKNALLILAFLSAVFQGDLRFSIFQNSPGWKYFAVGVVLLYFCIIFQQAYKNEKRYERVYKLAADQLYSEALKDLFYPSKNKEDFDERTDQMVEDEGRLRICLFAVVLVLTVLIGFQICKSAKAPSGHPAAIARHGSAPNSVVDGLRSECS